jgi:hypothetical protein
MGNKLPILAAALIGLIAGAAIIYAITPVPPSTKAPDSRPAANLPSNGPDTGPLPDESAAAVAEITKERDEARDAAETAAAQLETARRETQAAEAAAESLQEQLSDLKAELAALRDERREAGFLPVDFGKWRDVEGLSRADWKELGETYTKMNELLKVRADDIREGRETDQKTMQRLGELNGTLIKHLVKIYGELPSHTDANGAFTHPANLVNILSGQLEGAGLPLTATQITELKELGSQYDQRWDALQASYTGDTWNLRKLVDEAELKEWFHDEMFKVTTAAQKAAALPPGVEGYLGLDMYSAGLMIMMITDPQKVSNVEDARTRLRTKAATQLGVDAAQFDANAYLIENWMTALSGMLAPMSQRQSQLIRTHDVITAGKAQLTALEALSKTLSISPEVQEAVKNAQVIWLPQVIQE